MVFSLAAQLFGSANERVLKTVGKLLPSIASFEATLSGLSDPDLQAQTVKLRARLAQGEKLDALLPEAFATVREAAKRTLGQRHYDVQMLGGIILHQGKIAEMRTGEGKTLVATLPVYLNALTGNGVHVVTVNDYLAKRDSDWMGQVYKFLGMTVGCITADITEAERRAAYNADITYGTNNEFGFDYLRDNMKFRLEDMVQRPFNFAIVDEVDSILIDEARTPLIISGPAEDSTAMYGQINILLPAIIADTENFEKDEKIRTVTLTDKGVEAAEEAARKAGMLKSDNLYDAQNLDIVHHLNQALRAHTLFRADVDYIVKDGKVIIIDEFTGRMMEGRRYSDGLHQALEAKEGVPVENENQTLASITFQNYFRMYPKLAGMTGTARTEEAEFEDIYGLKVVDIPPNRGVARIDYNDQIYKTQADKIQAILTLIADCRKREQPVLVGTTSIEKSELLSAHLKKLKIPHQVLNARYHEQEAMIVAQAGRKGAVTIATNMAGRGTDIQLGGNPELPHADDTPESILVAREDVRAAGGLYIIGTERHESRRIDNQLRGRSGRQGDPGASIFFLSLEDDLMRIFGAERLEPLLAHKKIGLRDGEALAHPMISKVLEKAQHKVEQQNFEMRKNLLKFDNVMNDQRKVIYEQRRTIMAAQTVEELIVDMRQDVLDTIFSISMPEGAFPEQWDIASLHAQLLRLFRLNLPLNDWIKEEGISQEIMAERITDAVNVSMAHKVTVFGVDAVRRFEKSVLLQKLDQHWKDHLLSLDHLRQGINLRAFAQRDPLNEYKTDAFMLFNTMLDGIKDSVTETLGTLEAPKTQTAAPVVVDLPTRAAAKLVESRSDPADTDGVDADNQPVISQRNALCSCGSGKKYKHCHGKIAGSA